MWIVCIALNRPYTFVVAALAIILMTPIVLQRTPTDVFPDIDIPVISVGWNYSGLSPQQMEDRTGQRLTLPINALLFRPEGTMAAVVGPDGRLNLKKIIIGRDFGASVEVLQGITPEDNIVINPPDALEQGQQVNVTAQNPEGMPKGQGSQNSKQ